MVEPVIIGDCHLYLGDCLEILPTLGKVHAVLTDPPYGIGAAKQSFYGVNKRRNSATAPTDYGDSEWDSKPCEQNTIELIRKQSNHQIIFGGNYFDLPPNSCWLVWDKLNDGMAFADCELAWTNIPQAVRRLRYKWAGMLQQDMKNKEVRVHPTQKPTDVMKWCITQLPDDCETILDPFMGSGTTGVACAKMGRKFIGIEIEPKYFDIACKRIEEAYRQPDMFVESPRKPEQLEATL